MTVIFEHDVNVVEINQPSLPIGGLVVLWLGRRTCDSMVVSSILGRRTIGRLVSTRMGDGLKMGVPPLYVTSHLGQLSLLPSVGRAMSQLIYHFPGLLTYFLLWVLPSKRFLISWELPFVHIFLLYTKRLLYVTFYS